MKKFIVCLIFLISFANAIQCYNGKNYVDIPESKLSDIGYTKYNITHSNFDCKIAYKRYLKIKEIEPVNISYVTKIEKDELEEPSKISSLLPICLLVIIVCIIWLIKIAIQKEPQDELYTVIQKETIKPKNDVKTEPDKFWNDLSEYSENLERIEQESLKKEPAKSWDDLSREYSENLRKIEEERVKNGFYETEKPKPLNLPISKSQSQYKFKSEYDFLLHRQEWLDCREHVFAEKGRHCCYCYKTNGLQVHHKFYLAYPNGKKVKPWEYPIDAFKVLCYDCHVKEHQTHKIKFYRISYQSNPKAFKCS